MSTKQAEIDQVNKIINDNSGMTKPLWGDSYIPMITKLERYQHQLRSDWGITTSLRRGPKTYEPYLEVISYDLEQVVMFKLGTDISNVA